MEPFKPDGYTPFDSKNKSVISYHRSRFSFGNHAGTSSVLLIFIVLCLVSFSALSLAGAMADYRLTEKISDRTQNYYAAVSEANVQIAERNAAAKTAFETDALSEEAFFELFPEEESFDIPISEYQFLHVVLSFRVPDSKTESFVTVKEMRTVTDTDSMQYDENLPVMTWSEE